MSLGGHPFQEQGAGKGIRKVREYGERPVFQADFTHGYRHIEYRGIGAVLLGFQPEHLPVGCGRVIFMGEHPRMFKDYVTNIQLLPDKVDVIDRHAEAVEMGKRVHFAATPEIPEAIADGGNGIIGRETVVGVCQGEIPYGHVEIRETPEHRCLDIGKADGSVHIPVGKAVHHLRQESGTQHQLECYYHYGPEAEEGQ